MSAVPRGIVLTGMTGTGKTAVGRLVAERLNRPFVDLDETIVAAAGVPIGEIFADEGEAGFRERERAAVQTLRPRDEAVIATGGWTVADAESRAHLERCGRLVCLTATPEAIAGRLASAETVRPVLGPGATAEHIAALAEERRPVYDTIPLQVETTDRAIERVAQHVLALLAGTAELSPHALPVAAPLPRGGYQLLVGAGLLDGIGPLLTARAITGRAVIVTDENVGPLYGSDVADSLEAAGLDVTVLELPAGEANKTLEMVGALYDELVEAELDRDDTVVALGGGTVTDTAGFAAATYLRGIRLVNVPTSLLAMVDAALGGKTGVNLPAGKNLVGAFWHPALVAADPTALETLPEPELRAGLAEIVKAALIGEPGLLEQLEDPGPPPADEAEAWTALVLRAATVKAAVVGADPTEQGQRMVLNLGHTVAHALEQATDYALSHGQAVAVGLVAAARLAARLDRAPDALADRVETLLKALGLPVRYAGPSPDDVLAAAATDKKRTGDRLRFVLPHAPGDVRVADDVAPDDVRAVLDALRADR